MALGGLIAGLGSGLKSALSSGGSGGLAQGARNLFSKIGGGGGLQIGGGGLFNRNPEKKAQRQSRRAEKKAMRQARRNQRRAMKGKPPKSGSGVGMPVFDPETGQFVSSSSTGSFMERIQDFFEKYWYWVLGGIGAVALVWKLSQPKKKKVGVRRRTSTRKTATRKKATPKTGSRSTGKTWRTKPRSSWTKADWSAWSKAMRAKRKK
jgi:hypothetical protein